jgi:hypothetical protein
MTSSFGETLTLFYFDSSVFEYMKIYFVLHIKVGVGTLCHFLHHHM